MELLIIGLIVYVVFSVIGEMAKRKPAPPPGRPMGFPPGTSETRPAGWPAAESLDEEGSGLEGSLVDEDNASPSEMDSASMEGEGSSQSPFYESTEGESVEGSDAGGDAFEGTSLEARPQSGEDPNWKAGQEEIDTFWAEDQTGWDEESGMEKDGAGQEPILRDDGDILRGIVLSEVLKRRGGLPRRRPNRRL